MNVFLITRNRICHLQVCKQAGMHIIAQLHHLTSRRCSNSHVVIYGVSGKYSEVPRRLPVQCKHEDLGAGY